MRKFFIYILPIISIVYSLLYGSFGGFRGNASAMSKIGLQHHFLFAIWGALTFLTLCGNLIIAYKRTRYKFHLPLLIITFIGMVLTVTCDFDYDKHTEYMLHCIGSLMFSAVMGITVFLLFLLCRKYIFTLIVGAVLVTDLILLLIFKETAFIELLPIFSGYILLSIHNSRKEKETVEIK